MNNFVDQFLEYTKEAESPTSYFRWAAYTTIAATLRDNVWFRYGLTRVYPNMYTLILSRRSSMVKKSTPLKVSLGLLEDVGNTKIINGRATIAGIIGVMTGAKTDQEGRPVTGASCILYSEEVSSLLLDDTYAIDTLTDWYDGHKVWCSTLGSTGAVRVEGICLSMLASSNEELVRSVFNSRANQGGLLARTFLIIESKKRQKNSLMFTNNGSHMSDTELVQNLKRISRIRGEMDMSREARQYFHDWYTNFEPLEENSSKTGIEGRIHVHALKLAMVKCVAESSEKVIRLKHIEESITECLDLLPGYTMFANGLTGPMGQVGREILLLLLESKDFQSEKKKIMFHLWQAGSDNISKALDTLNEAGFIQVFSENGVVYLKLTKTFLEKVEIKQQ
jgi:hypothetical protein